MEESESMFTPILTYAVERARRMGLVKFIPNHLSWRRHDVNGGYRFLADFPNAPNALSRLEVMITFIVDGDDLKYKGYWSLHPDIYRNTSMCCGSL